MLSSNNYIRIYLIPMKYQRQN